MNKQKKKMSDPVISMELFFKLCSSKSIDIFQKQASDRRYNESCHDFLYNNKQKPVVKIINKIQKLNMGSPWNSKIHQKKNQNSLCVCGIFAQALDGIVYY